MLLCLATFANERKQFNAAGRIIADKYTCLMQGVKCFKFIKSKWGEAGQRGQCCVFSEVTLRVKAAKEKNFVYRMRPGCSETLHTEIMNEGSALKMILYSVR